MTAKVGMRLDAHAAVDLWVGAVAEYRRLTAEAVAGHICVYCAAPAETFDHLVPRSYGGEDRIGNLLPVCRACNYSKRDLSLAAWIEELGKLAEVVPVRLAAAKRIERLFGERGTDVRRGRSGRKP